jgi:arginase family enzyme
VDADVLDKEVARANAYATPGGLTNEALTAVARQAASEFEIVSIALTAYDPAIDRDAAVPPILSAALEELLKG